MSDLDFDMDVDVLAAMLRADQQETADFFELLAHKLRGALPDHTTIEHSGGWFREKRVEVILVQLADHHFEVRREHHGPVAHKVKIVRGVVLSRKEVSIDVWTRDMAEELHKAAAASAKVREALEQFLK